MPKGIYKHKRTQGFFGKKRPKQWRDEHSKRMKGNTNGFKKGHKINLGRKRPDLIGKNNPSWKDGVSLELYGTDWTDDLKESIRKRDNYTCQECGTHQDELSIKLDIHHIDYDKDNLNPINLISLCRKCHVKTNFNRKYWEQYFNNLIKQIYAL